MGLYVIYYSLAKAPAVSWFVSVSLGQEMSANSLAVILYCDDGCPGQATPVVRRRRREPLGGVSQNGGARRPRGITSRTARSDACLAAGQRHLALAGALACKCAVSHHLRVSASASPTDGSLKQGDVTDIEMSRTSDNVSAEDTDVDNGPWVTLDDGTGLLRVSLAPVCEAHAKHGEPWNATRGMYVLVLAVLEIEEPGQPAASAIFVKDLTGEPDRLAMWWCELMDAEQQSAVPSTHSGKADRQSA